MMDEKKAHEIYKKIFKGESDPVVLVTNNELYGLDQAEFTFLQRYREVYLKSAKPYMEGTPSHPYIAEKVLSLKSKFIVPVCNPEKVTKIIGPTIVSKIPKKFVAVQFFFNNLTFFLLAKKSRPVRHLKN